PNPLDRSQGTTQLRAPGPTDTTRWCNRDPKRRTRKGRPLAPVRPPESGGAARARGIGTEGLFALCNTIAPNLACRHRTVPLTLPVPAAAWGKRKKRGPSTTQRAAIDRLNT